MPLSLIPVRLPALPYWAQVAVLAVIYFTTARLGLLLAIPPGNASAVWPPSGIALAAALVFGYRLWPGIWLGATLANAMTEVSLLTALSMGIGNTLESLLEAFLLRRFSDFSGAFERIEQVFNFVLFTCVSSLIAATVGTTGLYFEGLLDGLSYSANWMTWWLGDVVGILVMTPLLLAWGRGFQIAWRSPLVVESLCFYGLLLGVSGWVFGTTEPLAYLLIPFIIWIPFILWAVFRFSQRRLTTASAMVAAIAVGGSIHGSGPFVVGTLHQSLFLLQVFIGFFAVLGFTLSALLRERRQAEASQRHLAAIVESSEDAIISKTLEGIITSWNAGAEKIFGYTAEEVLGRPIILLIPPERQAEEQE